MVKIAIRLLYHFTCDHGHAGITRTGVIVPNIHPLMRGLGPLIWLTDFAEPTKKSVGLTNSWTSCDRLAYRYSVRTKAAVRWADIRQRAPKEIVETLESFGTCFIYIGKHEQRFKEVFSRFKPGSFLRAESITLPEMRDVELWSA